MATLQALETQLVALMESQVDLWQKYVDPRELYNDDGEKWMSLGGDRKNAAVTGQVYRTDIELDQIREHCRWLANENEFAINGHENRINYVIGWGHTYTVVGRNKSTSPESIARVKVVLDAFRKANRWEMRQQEIMRRYDRDGEVFLRFFPCGDGILRVRFIEPSLVRTPPSAPDHCSFGIDTDPEDVETVRKYFLHQDQGPPIPVDASDIQHRKANVDSGCKRGLPTFYPVRKNLTRAVKLLRNISVASEIQTAIALIRKHQNATKEAVRTFISGRANAQGANPDGRTESILKYAPGSIIDAASGTEYAFPNAGLDVSKYVLALDAELRAIASRLVMPEFMLSSNAANANFASTMVAEGPAVKNFERLQQGMISEDLEVMQRAIDHAVAAGHLSLEDADACEVQAEPPTVRVRDGLQESQIRQIDVASGILSPQTASAQAGYDYETEQDNIDQARERSGGALATDRPMLPEVPHAFSS